ncbi:hypothetical protein R1flu_012714 [Riccia fluitans]|uniref:Uncharacterized protein n=1 Tax=Riccia fluitans TaxID=41844 RepID=A0ABD1ZES4_9MARC
MELPAFKREGSNKHIKDCERASQQLKFEIRALDNKERERAAVLSSLHDKESTSRALVEEEREIESAFPGSIRGEPSSLYAGGPQGSDARPQKLSFSSPSSVANASTHFDSNLVFSQTLHNIPFSPHLDEPANCHFSLLWMRLIERRRTDYGLWLKLSWGYHSAHSHIWHFR